MNPDSPVKVGRCVLEIREQGNAGVCRLTRKDDDDDDDDRRTRIRDGAALIWRSCGSASRGMR